MQVTNSKKYLAEGLGTFILVLLGCGAASLHWFTAGGPQGIDIVRIALAFGLTVMVLVYIFGPISGCHINPAVTVSMLIVRRISARDAIVYIICQCLGAIAAAAILYFLTSQALGSAIPEWALGSTGWGEGFHGEFGTLPAFVTELLLTYLLLLIIFGATSTHSSQLLEGIIIGLGLSSLILFGITISGVSLNPARSLGPAIFAGGKALNQLWLFILAPIAGGILAGFTHRIFINN